MVHILLIYFFYVCTSQAFKKSFCSDYKFKGSCKDSTKRSLVFQNLKNAHSTTKNKIKTNIKEIVRKEICRIWILLSNKLGKKLINFSDFIFLLVSFFILEMKSIRELWAMPYR